MGLPSKSCRLTIYQQCHFKLNLLSTKYQHFRLWWQMVSIEKFENGYFIKVCSALTNNRKTRLAEVIAKICPYGLKMKYRVSYFYSLRCKILVKPKSQQYQEKCLTTNKEAINIFIFYFFLTIIVKMC